jgi:hypothetical protein
MHNAPMWPIRGGYECRTCGRHHNVLWDNMGGDAGNDGLPQFVEGEVVSGQKFVILRAASSWNLPSRDRSPKLRFADNTSKWVRKPCDVTSGPLSCFMVLKEI